MLLAVKYTAVKQVPATKLLGNPTGSAAAASAIGLSTGLEFNSTNIRVTSSVPTSVVNDTNVTGSISGNALTLGWTGTLAAARLNSNVVQSVVNDTNVTGSISGQALTLGWTGTLALARIDQTIAPTWTGVHINAPAARSSGVAPFWSVRTPADTSLTASTEAIGAQYGGNSSAATVTRQYATGALATHRENYMPPVTLAAVGASTISTAVNFETASPIQGTNATLTASIAARFIASSAAHIPLISKGATSQSGDLQRWVDSTDATLAKVDSAGQFTVGTIFQIGVSGNTTRQLLLQGASTSHQIWVTGAGSSQAAISLGANSTASANVKVFTNAGGNSSDGTWNIAGTTKSLGGAGNTCTMSGCNGSGADLAGGDVIIQPGKQTGTSTPGMVRLQGCIKGTASNSTVATVIDRVITGCAKVLTNNSAIGIVNCTEASGSMIGGCIEYTVEVTDGTDFQVYSGIYCFNGTNKAGTIANTITLQGTEVQNKSAGTLTVTFAISNANPAVISVNANSSLTPSSGYPRITYDIHNQGQQAVAIQ